MTKRALITGVMGFAGRYLAGHLASRGYEVYGASNVHSDSSVDGVRQILQSNLNDASSIADVVAQIRPTHVFHLAAVSFVDHEDIREIYETNIVGTRNLLKGLSGFECRPDAVVLTSSANVYGNSTREILTEADEVNPANDYAVSKIAMEYMARQFADLGVVIARPFNYTGRGQSEAFLIPKIVNHYRKRAPRLELGNLEVARDFSDVRVVVDYLRRLAEAPATRDGVYNICSGQPHSLQYIIETCERISGHRLEVHVNPRFVRTNEVKSLAGSAEKLHAAVGCIQDTGIEDLLAWMLSEPLV